MTIRKLGSYELEEEIGRGAMGVVYRAVQPSLGRQVAVKVLLPHLGEDPEFVERFLREARSAANLDHPGIVTIHDVGEIDGTYFFCMQYLTGQTLEEVIRSRGGLPVEHAVAILAQLAEALGYAHQEGIVHRDVKPSNILLDKNSRPVITDFGIAWAASDTRLTRTGSTIGSPEYMSPEQISGQQVDRRSDLYSLGVVFYQMLTGVVPYSGDTALAVAYQHVHDPVRSPQEANPRVPPELDAIAQRLMAKSPDDRYDSAAELLQDLAAAGMREQATLSMEELPDRTLRVETLETQTDLPATDKQRVYPRRAVWLVGLLISLVGLAVVAGLYLQVSGGAEGGSSQAAEEAVAMGAVTSSQPAEAGEQTVAAGSEPEGSPAAGSEVLALLNIAADLPGLEIWVDGSDSGMVTPAGVILSGEAGEEVIVELRRGDAVVAENRLVLGDDLPDTWAPELSLPVEKFQITSQPEGARVSLDGRELAERTPAFVELRPGREYRLAVELEGYDAAGFNFAIEELSDSQRQLRRLHFPLTSSIPPGFLVVEAEYPVRVEIGGREFAAGEGQEIRLPPGTHEVRLSAPEVFYSARERVDLESDEKRTLVAPPATAVTVAAAPSHCRVVVDGRPVGFVPLQLQLAVGSHEFEFHWDTLGKSLRRRQSVGLGTDRVFAAAPEQ